MRRWWKAAGGAERLLIITMFLMVAVLISGIISVKLSQESAERDDEQDRRNHQQLVQGAYETCEDQNTLREIDRVDKSEDIAQQRNTSYAEIVSYGLTISPERYERLQREQIARLKRKRRRLHGIDCEARYPEAEFEEEGEVGPNDERRLTPEELRREIRGERG